MTQLLKIFLFVGYIGFVNFIKSCALPFAAGYFVFFGSICMRVLADNPKPKFWQTFKYGVIFALGFVLIFVAKSATVTAIGHSLSTQVTLYTRLGGVMIMIVGLAMLPLPEISKFFNFRRWAGWASLAAGATFALSWQPCSVFVIPAIQEFLTKESTLGAGILFLTLIGIGIVIPLLILSILPSLIFKYIKLPVSFTKAAEAAGSALLIILGFMFLTGTISVFYGLISSIQSI